MKKITLVLFAFFLSWQINAQVNYSYDWEPQTPAMGGWTSGSSYTFFRSETTPCDGSASARNNLFSNQTAALTSPLIPNSNGGIVTLTFDYKVTKFSSNTTGAPANQMGIDVQSSNSSSGPWNTVESIGEANHVVSATCAAKTVTFSALPGNLYIRFLTKSPNGADVYYYFDTITVTQGAAPSCIPPTTIVASNVTASTAVVSWTVSSTIPANGYEYYYSAVNEAPTVAGTAKAGLTANLTGLSSNTSYYVWMRSMCDATSAWNGPILFKTLCSSFDIPFYEKFNSDSPNKNCWTVVNANGDADAWNLS